jgi:hypothetical protein
MVSLRKVVWNEPHCSDSWVVLADDGELLGSVQIAVALPELGDVRRYEVFGESLVGPCRGTIDAAVVTEAIARELWTRCQQQQAASAKAD